MEEGHHCPSRPDLPTALAEASDSVDVFADLCGFARAHRNCAGPRHANAGPTTGRGYRLFVVCGCGAEFKRWVAPEDADENLLRSTLLAFET